jgi:hypothetical protein
MKTTSKIAAAALASALVLSGTAGVTNAKAPGKSNTCGKAHVAKKSVGKKGNAKKAAKPCVAKTAKKAKKA